MIVVSTQQLEDKLDSLWYKLQRVLEQSQSEPVSQRKLDEITILWLEDMIINEAKMGEHP
jgi:hypothetical protein